MAAAKEATSPGGLAAALLAFQSEMPTVSKGKTAKVKSKSGVEYSYTYADLAAVSAAATPLLVQNGLTFSCQPRRCGNGDYELVGVLRHVSGESDEGALPIHGRDAQEIGSSITYGRRYLLGCLTGVITDDDDDAGSVIGAGRTRRQDPEPPPETPEQALSNARAGAWATYRDTTQNATPEGFSKAYEDWCKQPFDAAAVDDFNRFAAFLRDGEKA